MTTKAYLTNSKSSYQQAHKSVCNKGIFGGNLFFSPSDAQKENTQLKQQLEELKLQNSTNEEKAKQIESDLVASNELLQKKAKEAADKCQEMANKWESMINEKAQELMNVKTKHEEEIKSVLDKNNKLQDEKMEIVVSLETERNKCTACMEKLLKLENKLPLLENELKACREKSESQYIII